MSSWHLRPEILLTLIKPLPPFDKGVVAWTGHPEGEFQSDEWHASCFRSVEVWCVKERSSHMAAARHTSTLLAPPNDCTYAGVAVRVTSTRRLLKWVRETGLQGPNCHPHLLLTLEYVQHQGHWGEGVDREHSAGCTAVTTRQEAESRTGTDTQGKEHAHVRFHWTHQAPASGVLVTRLRSIKQNGVTNIWLNTVLLWLITRLQH